MTDKITRRRLLEVGAAGTSALSLSGWVWSAGAPPVLAANAYPTDTASLDTLAFGDTASEASHATTTTLSDVITGGLKQSARVFNPTSPASYWGGTATFTMKCAPQGTTYVTVKLWGGDIAAGFDDETIGWRLQLFAEGKQVGYQEQSAVDSLDIMCDEPRLPGRFYFHTLPLPEAMTAGKTSIELEIRAEGRIWPYGQNTSQFYYNLTAQSRGVYRVYTHTAPYFIPAPNDPQGPAPVPTIRKTPGAEVLDQIKTRVQNDLSNWLYVPMTDLWAIVAVAEAYFVSGNPCYKNDAAIDRVLSDLDAVYYLWKTNRSATDITAQQWEGLGRMGHAVVLLKDVLGDRLSKPVTSGSTELINGGVEAGVTSPVGWNKATWAGSATFVWDNTVSHSGTHSLKLTPNAAGYGPGWGSARVQVEQGTYQYSAWVKMDSIVAQGVYMTMLFYDSSGKFVVEKKFYAPTPTGTNDWQQIVGIVDTPTGATQFEMYLGFNGTGTAWFDDMALVQLSSGLIPNNGFEVGSGGTVDGWHLVTWAGSATFVWDNTVSHSGTYSLKLTPDAAGYGPGLSPTRRIAANAGSTYKYGVWVKTDSVTGSGVYTTMLFYDSSGNFVTEHKTYAPTPTGTNDWQPISGGVTTPTGATQFELYLGFNGTGTAWFDDVTFVDENAPVPLVRSTAYAEVLKESQDYWRQHIPHYSNQVQICALGIYLTNCSLQLLAPDKALPEKQARNYIYQGVGLLPYLGPEDANGTPSKPLGGSYYQVTPKGLTRELGYVGNYGEVTSWLVMLYEAVTRIGGVQDATLRDQIIKMVKARAIFRYPGVDANCNRVMRLETMIGWRDDRYPGDVNYAQRGDWDGHSVQAAAVLNDPEITGYAQQMMADNQCYGNLHWPLLDIDWPRVGLNAERFVQRDWPAFTALSASNVKMPTDWDAPDFVFSDEVNAVVALKRGKELLFVNLYWRARQAVNNYARIHYLTPTTERSGTIRVQSQVASTGTWTVRDWIMWDFAINDPGAAIPSGGWSPLGGENLHQAFAGVTMPIGHWPADVPDPALGVHTDGVETLFVGKADFYRCEFGRYLIGMNTTSDKTYTLQLDKRAAVHLVTGKTFPPNCVLEIPPMSTVTLYLHQDA